MVGYSNPLSPSPNNAAAVAQNTTNILAAQQQQQQQQAYSHQVHQDYFLMAVDSAF